MWLDYENTLNRELLLLFIKKKKKENLTKLRYPILRKIATPSVENENNDDAFALLKFILKGFT